MANNQNELDLTLTKSNAVVGGQRMDNEQGNGSSQSSPQNRPNSSLPSSVGLSPGATTSSGCGGSSQSNGAKSFKSKEKLQTPVATGKKGKGKEKPKTPAAAGRDSTSAKKTVPVGGKFSHPKQAAKTTKGQVRVPQPGQARASKRSNDMALINHEINVYRMTNWYKKAVEAGFKNEAAIEKFNALVNDLIDDIDPSVIPVCGECGHSDVKLCKCSVVQEGVVALEDDALAIPDAVNIWWNFRLFDNVKRMFTWPRFSSANNVNHDIGGFDNTLLGDSLIHPEMLAYIRQFMNVSYELNGVYRRELAVAHAHKLALRYLDLNIKRGDARYTPHITNMMYSTVQKAVDSQDTTMLVARANEVHNSFWEALYSTVNRRNIIILAAVISPVMLSRLVSVSMRANLFVYSRLMQTNFRILLSGSKLVLWCTAQNLMSISRVLAHDIWSGMVRPCLSATRQLLSRIVPTMSSTLLRNDIWRPLHFPSRINWTGVCSVV